jgi:glycosyltransferase involved in cell wall biosynthesis
MVIGPVGGGLTSPTAFAAEEGTEPLFMRLRRLDRLRLAHDPLLRRTYEEAACVLAVAPYVLEHLAHLSIRRFAMMSETGLEVLPPSIDRRGRTGPVKALFVGRLVRTKGARDAIRAMALCADLPLTLDIVGDGPDRAACEALAERVGVAGRVAFHGRLPRAVVDQRYAAADLFVFPSYREPSGNVVFEAMGHGLPLIVCDRGGPGAAVDPKCAIRLPVTTPEALARDVAAAMRRLVTDETLRLTMGRAARRHVERTALWPAKIARMNALFEQLAALPSPRTKLTSDA